MLGVRRAADRKDHEELRYWEKRGGTEEYLDDAVFGDVVYWVDFGRDAHLPHNAYVFEISSTRARVTRINTNGEIFEGCEMPISGDDLPSESEISGLQTGLAMGLGQCILIKNTRGCNDK